LYFWTRCSVVLLISNQHWIVDYIPITESHRCIFFFPLFYHYIFYNINRRKVPHHSVRDIISHTQAVVDVVKLPITSKRRLVPHVDTHQRRWDNTIGHKRRRVAAQPELVVCDTWKQWPVNSRMDSEKEHKQRNKLLIKLILSIKCHK